MEQLAQIRRAPKPAAIIASAVCSGVVAMLIGLAGTTRVDAQQPSDGQIKTAIERGKQFLLGKGAQSQSQGHAAMIALALVKAGVNPENPVLAQLLEQLRGCAPAGTFVAHNERQGIYEAGAIAMALGAVDPEYYKPQITAIAQYIMSHQNPNGSWNYPGEGQSGGDTSVTQYAMLGLWEAARVGVPIPAKVWQDAAQWHVSRQLDAGGFAYRPRDPARGAGNPRNIAQSVRHSTTVAGMGSMLICGRHLSRGGTGKPEKPSLLKPVHEPEEEVVVVGAPPSGMRRAIAKAENWLAKNFTVSPDSVSGRYYYYLYALERFASLAGKKDEKSGEVKQIGGLDWYYAGAAALLAEQGPAGGWKKEHSPGIDTSFALLFLTRSTQQILRKERFAGGTQLGGRGLPSDLTQVNKVEHGKLLVRPPTGGVVEMIRMIESGNAVDARAAAEGLVGSLDKADPETLRMGFERLEKLAEHPKPQIREVAVWALARQKTYRAFPVLIRALEDPDMHVMLEARNGLRLLSRKFRGFGLSAGSTPDQREAVVARWQAWYESLDPDAEWRRRQPLPQ